MNWDDCDKAELRLIQVKEWVQYWEYEPELADDIFVHLKQAIYLLGIAVKNMEELKVFDDPSPPELEDI